MTTFTETGHACGFIISEASGDRSRDNVTLVSGAVVLAGQVLGVITSGGKYDKYDNQDSDGTQAAVAISLYDVDATAGDTVISVISRDAEVNGDELVYLTGSPTDVTAAIADLKALGIIVR